MKTKCSINEQDPNWIELVNAIGSTKATNAFVIHNELEDRGIPSIEEANIALSDNIVLEKGESFNRATPQFKIEKINNQIKTLDKITSSNRLNGLNSDQKITVAKLRQNALDYKEYLENEEDNAISVSAAVGASILNKEDAEKYESFKYLGTFIHNLIEDVQLLSINENQELDKVFSETLFNEIYDEYQKSIKNKLAIEGLDKSDLFEVTKKIINGLSGMESNSYVVIPELTLFGKLSNGKGIVGRADIVIVDNRGRAKIVDLKTKKMQTLMVPGKERDENGNQILEPNLYAAYGDLAKPKNTIGFSETPSGEDEIDRNKRAKKMFPEFKTKQNRNIFEVWAIQGNIYGNIIEQMGIEVADISFAAYLYQTDLDQKFQGGLYNVLKVEDFYHTLETLPSRKQRKEWERGLPNLKTSMEFYLNAINRNVPVLGKNTGDKKEDSTILDEEFSINEKTEKQLADRVEKDIDEKISLEKQKIAKEKKEKHPNEGLINTLEDRLDTYEGFRTELDKIKAKGGVVSSVTFNIMVNLVESDLDNLNANAELALTNYNLALENKDEEKATIYRNQMKSIKGKNAELREMIKIFMKVANDSVKAGKGEKGSITKDSLIYKKIGLMTSNIEEINSMFNEMSLDSVVKAIMTPGPKVFKRVYGQLEQAFLPEIDAINAKIEDLQKGDGGGIRSSASKIFSKNRVRLFSLLSPKYKNKIQESFGNGQESKLLLKRIEELKEQVEQKKTILEVFENFDEKAIREFIKNVNDSDAKVYLSGSDIFWKGSAVGSHGSKFLASAASSDILVSGIVQMFKNAAAEARIKTQEDFVVGDFDKALDKLRETYTPEEINKLISGWSTKEVYNPDTGEIEEIEELTFVKPISDAYIKKYHSFTQRIKEASKNKKIAKAAYFDEKRKGNKNLSELEQSHIKAQHEYESIMNEKLQWEMANSSMQMISSYYDSIKNMPLDLREKIELLQLEKQSIVESGGIDKDSQETFGRGYEFMQSDEDWTRFKEIEDTISKLLNEFREENSDNQQTYEEYQAHFDKFVDIRMFNRRKEEAMQLFAEDPEKLKQWKLNNTVTKPNSAWYTEKNRIYEEIQKITKKDQDPVMKELFERRSLILRPHKSGGVLRSEFLNEEEIAELSSIERAIEKNKKLSKGDLLNYDSKIREKLKDLYSALGNLTVKEINPVYQNELKQKTRSLNNLYQVYIDAQVNLDNVLSNKESTPEDIEEAEHEKFTSHLIFIKMEVQYGDWYNRQHLNSYKTILTGNDPMAESIARPFNYMDMPPDSLKEVYLDFEVPHPKFQRKIAKRGTWELNGERLSNIQIDSYLKDLDKVRRLRSTGELKIGDEIEGGENTAYNLDYMVSPDGIPMPNNIYSDNGVYKINTSVSNELSDGSGDKYNSKYRKITEDTDLFDFYNKLMKMYFSYQEQIEGRKAGFMVPGAAATFIDNFKWEDGLKGAFGKQIEKFWDRNVKLYGAQDEIENTYGDLGDTLRLIGNRQLPKEIQSKDAIGSLMKWFAEAQYNIAMQKVAPHGEATIIYIESMRDDLNLKIAEGLDSQSNEVYRRRAKELTTTIDFLRFEADKFLYGKNEQSTNRNRFIDKKIGLLFSIASFGRIGFDVANQVKNYVAGNVQTWIAGGNLESNHYSNQDLIKAKAKVYKMNGLLPNLIRDIGKISNLTESTMLFRRMNPTQEEYTSLLKNIVGGSGRVISGTVVNFNELAYFGQSKGELEIAGTTMYAVMEGYKVNLIDGYNEKGEIIYKLDKEGEKMQIPASEAYELDSNGVLQIRGDVEYSAQDEDMLRHIVYHEMRRAQGNYASADKTLFESTDIGKLAFFYRKYLFPLMLNRFGALRPSWEGAELSIGFWTGTYRAFSSYSNKDVWRKIILGDMDKSGNINDWHSKSIKHARKDIAIIGLLSFLSMVAMSIYQKYDDDDEEIPLVLGNAIRILVDVSRETRSMTAIGKSGEDYINNFTSLTTASREFVSLTKSLTHVIGAFGSYFYGVDPTKKPMDEDGFVENWIYKNTYYSRKSGPYQKGDLKLSKDLADFSGYKNIRDLFQPENRLEKVK